MDSTAMLYIVVSVVAVLFAFGLAYFASSSKAAKVRAEAASRAAYKPQAPLKREGLNIPLSDEINKIVESPEQRDKIATAVSGIVDKEVDRRLNTTKQELTKKYEGIVAQKTENEEVQPHNTILRKMFCCCLRKKTIQHFRNFKQHTLYYF